MNNLHVANPGNRLATQVRRAPTVAPEILNESAFMQLIAVERKRTERSTLPFLLILLDAKDSAKPESSRTILGNAARSLLHSIRETDFVGWWKDPDSLGVIFTGIEAEDKSAVLKTILSRVSTTLRLQLTAEQFNQINITYCFFPDDWADDGSGPACNHHLYPDLFRTDSDKRVQLCLKRIIDIGGSALLLVLSAPLLIIVAIAVKLSSPGSVLFKQQRVGQYGRQFTFLKFRSMTMGCDSSVHKDFALKLITNKVNAESSLANGGVVYKMKSDKRVTRVGSFLRRTSLDELPQLLNVLMGDMSLVGPRPPIPYEVAAYNTWHRRRVLQAKPGVTGLWQVTGRSRVSFDEMVRLDLQYSSLWTLGLDMKILLQTPLAVIKGTGAC